MCTMLNLIQNGLKTGFLENFCLLWLDYSSRFVCVCVFFFFLGGAQCYIKFLSIHRFSVPVTQGWPCVLAAEKRWFSPMGRRLMVPIFQRWSCLLNCAKWRQSWKLHHFSCIVLVNGLAIGNVLKWWIFQATRRCQVEEMSVCVPLLAGVSSTGFLRRDVLILLLGHLLGFRPLWLLCTGWSSTSPRPLLLLLLLRRRLLLLLLLL